LERVDVAVVGAGTAGSTTAAVCASRGLRVVVLEARDLSHAGARWVNAVPDWCFREAGLAEPSGAELAGRGGRFHLVAGWGPERVSVDAIGVASVDMRELGARLHREAEAAGAELRGRVRVRAVHDAADGDRAVVETDRGVLEARWVVDASGLAGLQRRVPGEDLCAAAQRVCAIADRRGADAFLAAHHLHDGDTISFTGVAGGYSVVNVRIDGDEVHLLAGGIPSDGEASGGWLLARFVAENRWIGEERFGGARAIPLARPPERLWRGPLVRVGDAASQVFAAHGSGVGAGLIAGRMLGEALSGEGPAAYNRAWQRRWGGSIASSVVLSRAARKLGSDGVAALVRSGALSPDVIAASLQQRDPGLLETLQAGIGGFWAPSAMAAMAPALARGAMVKALYSRFPDDEGAIDAWAWRVRRLMGEAPAEPAVSGLPTRA
jgi:flavin-dependent dehydrogenase